MIPDARASQIVRGGAYAAYAACAVLACERSLEPAAARGPRIVSVGGAITETVFALGAGDRVVAIDTSSTYPPQVAQLPRVGYQRTLSAEGILAQAPDLVLLADEAGPPAAIEQLRAAGVRIARMPPALTIEEAAARIVAIGAAIDRPASALANEVRRAAHAARTPAARPCVLVYARGAGTLMVAGRDTAGAAMIELAGCRNAAASFAGFKPLSAEAMIAAAPELIVVPSRGLVTLGGEDGLLALPGVAATPAGRARRIVALDDLLLLGFGPRLAVGIDELARRVRAAP